MNDESNGGPQLSKRPPWYRRTSFYLLATAGAYAIAECASIGILVYQNGSLSGHAHQRHQAATLDRERPIDAKLLSPTILHPYIGAVLQQSGETGDSSIQSPFRITDYGFVDEGPPIHRRSADRLIIGIVGGPIAHQLSLNATDVLARELSQFPEFVGRNIQFVRMTGERYKQPQQLMILSYTLSLGAEFDIVINLDGFNEVVLPIIDNIPFGVNSAYPGDWGKMTVGISSPEYLRIAGLVVFLREQQRARALQAETFPWNYSGVAQAIWTIRHSNLEREIANCLTELKAISQHETTFSSAGPPESFDSVHDMYSYCMHLWCRASIQLKRECDVNNIRYFHFLQPNQYLSGSKPIGPEEAEVAISAESPVKEIVQVCFPIMRTEFKLRLEQAGVEFADLTQVFAEHPENLYNDDRCHTVPEGDRIIARSIASEIRRFLEANSWKNQSP